MVDHDLHVALMHRMLKKAGAERVSKERPIFNCAATKFSRRFIHSEAKKKAVSFETAPYAFCICT